MTNTIWIKITKKKFMSYESVRLSGVVNMFMISSVADLSELTKEEVKDIMENYSKYSKKYLNK